MISCWFVCLFVCLFASCVIVNVSVSSLLPGFEGSCITRERQVGTGVCKCIAVFVYISVLAVGTARVKRAFDQM